MYDHRQRPIFCWFVFRASFLFTLSIYCYGWGDFEYFSTREKLVGKCELVKVIKEKHFLSANQSPTSKAWKLVLHSYKIHQDNPINQIKNCESNDESYPRYNFHVFGIDFFAVWWRWSILWRLFAWRVSLCFFHRIQPTSIARVITCQTAVSFLQIILL